GDVDLGQNNTPRSYTATATAPGYWYQQKTVAVDTGPPKHVDFALVKQCTGTLGGGAVVFEDGSPAANHLVGIDETGQGWAAATRHTDSQGRFTFDRDEPLGYNNAPHDYTLIIYASATDPPGTVTNRGPWHLGRCGDRSSGTWTIVRPPVAYGAVEGFVRDEQTNLPIAGALVTGFVSDFVPGNISPIYAFTDADGHYRVENVLVGFDTRTAVRYVSASKTGYYLGTVVATLTADQTTRVDLTLLARHYGTARGHVRDAVTGAPIAAANVGSKTCASLFCTSTDRDGAYATNQVPLGDRNTPNADDLVASAPGYWPQSKLVQFEDGTTTTTDFDLLRRCALAKIVGTVVNALTQAPI